MAHLQQLPLGVLPSTHAHLACGQPIVQPHRPRELVAQLLEDVERLLHLGAALAGGKGARARCTVGGSMQHTAQAACRARSRSLGAPPGGRFGVQAAHARPGCQRPEDSSTRAPGARSGSSAASRTQRMRSPRTRRPCGRCTALRGGAAHRRRTWCSPTQACASWLSVASSSTAAMALACRSASSSLSIFRYT